MCLFRAAGLERVALHDCRSVSRQGVVALLQMTSLKRVVISKCPQVCVGFGSQLQKGASVGGARS